MRHGTFGGIQPRKSTAHIPRNRKITQRDIIRKIYKESGALDQLAKVRNTPTDLERLLSAAHLSEDIARGATKAEQLQLEADLRYIGILPGRTAGTLPERLVAKWLVDHQVEYGGMGNMYSPGRNFGFQIPLVGGRGGSGSVVDIFLSGPITATPQGVALRVNGVYFHNTPDAQGHDEAQRIKLEAAGYRVSDITDVEVLQRGVLDQKMKQLVYV